MDSPYPETVAPGLTVGEYERQLWASVTNKRSIYVFQIEPDEPLKIGSGKVLDRRAATQTQHWRDVHLLHCFPGSLQIEYGLHGHFDKERVRGEWFEPSTLPVLEALAWLMIEYYKTTGKIADPLKFFHRPKTHRGDPRVTYTAPRFREPLIPPSFTSAADRYDFTPSAPPPGPLDYIERSYQRDA